MKASNTKKRPISPHLTIYKPMITSASSILGRLAGVYVYLVTVFIAVFIALTIQDNKDVGSVLTYFFTILEHGGFKSVLLFLFSLGSIFAFFLYIFSLIRHLIWDFGYCLDLKISKILGYGMFITSFSLSFWLNYYMFF